MSERGWITDAERIKRDEDPRESLAEWTKRQPEFNRIEITNPEPDLELEFKAIYICMESHVTCGNGADKITDYLNEGWQVDGKITCPPYVIITFSREREIKENVR